MNQDNLRDLLEKVRDGQTTPEEAAKRLDHLPFEDLGFAKVDHHRALRHGMPEVILGRGKTPAEVRSISEKLLERSKNLLVTRANEEMAAVVRELDSAAEYFPRSGCLRVWRDKTIRGKEKIAVVCAGTSDLPVAEEARVTCEVMGNEIIEIYDVGVAGIHRLLGNLDKLADARVIICCAGMEGALPSAVGGIVSVPVIAVPTSVGYGASFNGLAALLGMLNSCSSNVTTMNIDNGFGAAYVATLINRI
ncbi:MAG: nickel pincer cofactor biosynthesis protein LarB [Acidobacteria bacterium]|nr:nickel pincer cofactor biosynthesis protein LarB [Acidobacteriota bacterium]